MTQTTDSIRQKVTNLLDLYVDWTTDLPDRTDYEPLFAGWHDGEIVGFEERGLQEDTFNNETTINWKGAVILRSNQQKLASGDPAEGRCWINLPRPKGTGTDADGNLTITEYGRLFVSPQSNLYKLVNNVLMREPRSGKDFIQDLNDLTEVPVRFYVEHVPRKSGPGDWVKIKPTMITPLNPSSGSTSSGDSAAEEEAAELPF